MLHEIFVRRYGAIAAIVLTGLASGYLVAQSSGRLTPSTMPRIGTVDERYQSFNV